MEVRLKNKQPKQITARQGERERKKKCGQTYKPKWEQQFQILNMLLINGAVAMDGWWQKSDNNISNKGGSDGKAVAAGSGLPARGLINEGSTIQGWFYSRPRCSPPSASKVDYSSTNSLNINQTGDTISPRNVPFPRPKWESKNTGEKQKLARKSLRHGWFATRPDRQLAGVFWSARWCSWGAHAVAQNRFPRVGKILVAMNKSQINVSGSRFYNT